MDEEGMRKLSLKSWVFHHCASLRKYDANIFFCLFLCYWYKLGYFKLKEVIIIIFVPWTLVLKFTVNYFSYWGEGRYEHSSFFFIQHLKPSLRACKHVQQLLHETWIFCIIRRERFNEFSLFQHKDYNSEVMQELYIICK